MEENDALMLTRTYDTIEAEKELRRREIKKFLEAAEKQKQQEKKEKELKELKKQIADLTKKAQKIEDEISDLQNVSTFGRK